MIISPAMPQALARYAGGAAAAATEAQRELTVCISCADEAFVRLMSTTASECDVDYTNYLISDQGALDLIKFALEKRPLSVADDRPGTIENKHYILCGSEDAKKALERFAELIGFECAPGVFRISATAAYKMAEWRS